MLDIKLNERQLKIIDIVKQYEPITGEKIAEKLNVTRATLRSDLVVLTMTNILDARPKVGYFYVGEGDFINEKTKMKDVKVSDVMGVPMIAHQGDSVYDVIVGLFIEDAGGVFILDEADHLCGVVSRKDLLKVTIGGGDVNKIPIGMIMTRMPNVAIVEENQSISDAAAVLVKREVDSLPVVRFDEMRSKMTVVGKVSKTLITRLFVELTE